MSEANVDEAAKALSLARSKLDSGDLAAATRFCKKSISLNSTSSAQHFLRELEAIAKDSSRRPTASSSAVPKPATEPKQRHAAKPQSRSYTPAHLAVVKRIKSCKPTAYYEILELEKSCDSSAIKKQFRKLSLTVHPDKNPAPGADEAFKSVLRAVEVLQDPDKRSHYDRHGTDPDDRSSRFASTSFASQGGRAPAAHFGEEISPEDLFNMFFGNAGFGGGNFQTFGPGVRVRTFGGPQRRPQAGQQGQAQGGGTPIWIQVLPLLVLFAFSMLSSLPSLLVKPPPPLPPFSLSSRDPYVLLRQTRAHNVPYFVEPKSFSSSPLWNDVLSSNPSLKTSEDMTELDSLMATSLDFLPGLRMTPYLVRFEQAVENAYVDKTAEACRAEMRQRQMGIERNQGFLGIGRNAAELARIYREPLPNCDILRGQFGYTVSYQ